jgi:hypothetical protein
VQPCYTDAIRGLFHEAQLHQANKKSIPYSRTDRMTEWMMLSLAATLIVRTRAPTAKCEMHPIPCGTGQQYAYPKSTRVIPSHCETRFGWQHLVLPKVLEIQHALRGICATSKFIDPTSKPYSEQAKPLHAVLTSIEQNLLFASGPILLELVNPIMDAVHKLEGDVSV